MATTVWRGYIAFGLISIPVRLFRAARSERVRLRELYRVPHLSLQPEPRPAYKETDKEIDEEPEPAIAIAPRPMLQSTDEVFAPVTRVAAQQTSHETIPKSALTKGYEYERDRFVPIDPDELKSIAAKTATEMEVLEFVKLAEIDPVFFETSYYVRPEEAGEKPYSLLYQSLQQTGLVALARFAMHHREHIVVLRAAKSGVLAHTMYFVSEIRANQEYKTDSTLVSEKDLDLAKLLISNLTSRFEPEKYRDTYKEKLEALIASKLQAKQTVTVNEVRRPAPVTDITEALRKSLTLLKKPPSSSERPSKKASDLKPRVRHSSRNKP